MPAPFRGDSPREATDPATPRAGRILVIRGGAIGDFVLTLPVLAALRQHFPQCHLEVLGYPHISKLALQSGLADHTRSIESGALARFFASGTDLDETWAAYFAQFALILSYLYDPDAFFQSNVARCSRAQFISCPHRPDEQLQLHATDTFLQPLERLAIFGADPVPRLNLPLSGASPSDLPLSRTIILHPGSGSPTKNWPESAWLELIAQLVALPDWEFLLVTGEAETDRVARLENLLPSGRSYHAHHLPLPELALRFHSCRAFLGHDSGISHLAAAVGLPGIVLWGPTNQAIWRPRSSRFRVLQSPLGLAHLEVRRVIDELNDLLAGSE
jgi:heptosyltransferase III